MADVRVGIHLLIPHPSRPAVLARPGSSELPGGIAIVPPKRPAIVAIVAFLADDLSLDLPVLEAHVRWDDDDDLPAGATIPTLVLTESPVADWGPPAGLEWRDLDGFTPDVPDVLIPRTATLIDELRLGDGYEPPALRPRWARRGWYERATRWMHERLTEAGRPPEGRPKQTYLRGISALLRAETPAGGAYLKAVFPPFATEPAISRLLAARFPGLVPNVLAIKPDEGWQLMDDLGGATVREDGGDADHAAGIRALVTIQRAMAGSTAELLALGCPARPIGQLASDLELALASEVAAETTGMSPDRRSRLIAWVADAVAAVEALGFPDTLVHGDFHPGNVALVGSRPVVFDWSDAAVSSPIVDLITWLEDEDQPARRESVLDVWFDSWSSAADPGVARATLDSIIRAGAAYQVVSYVGILEHLEPATRYTVADGLTHFLKKLESAVPV